MLSIDLFVPDKSLAEVGARLGEQVAASDVSELRDPVRFHGAEKQPGVFALRRYEWRPVQNGGRARFETRYVVRLMPHANGTAVRMHVDGAGGIVIKAAALTTPFLIVLVAIVRNMSGASHAGRGDIAFSIAVALAILAVIYSASFALFRAVAARSLRDDRDFLKGWLGAND